MFAYNIFLIGFMGTGKSTVSRNLAQKYDFIVAEMDEEIAIKEEKSIPQIFEKCGEEYFRNLETKYLEDLQSSKGKVVSCGGGAVLRKENVILMKKIGKVILLTASPDVIYERVKDDNGRPLLQGRKNLEAIKDLMEERREKYENAADIVVDTEGKAVQEICEEIIHRILEEEEA